MSGLRGLNEDRRVNICGGDKHAVCCVESRNTFKGETTQKGGITTEMPRTQTAGG